MLLVGFMSDLKRHGHAPCRYQKHTTISDRKTSGCGVLAMIDSRGATVQDGMRCNRCRPPPPGLFARCQFPFVQTACHRFSLASPSCSHVLRSPWPKSPARCRLRNRLPTCTSSPDWPSNSLPANRKSSIRSPFASTKTAGCGWSKCATTRTVRPRINRRCRKSASLPTTTAMDAMKRRRSSPTSCCFPRACSPGAAVCSSRWPKRSST